MCLSSCDKQSLINVPNRAVWRAIIMGQFLSLVLCFMTLVNHHINTASYKLTLPTGKTYAEPTVSILYKEVEVFFFYLHFHSRNRKSLSIVAILFLSIVARKVAPLINCFSRDRTKSSALRDDVLSIHDVDVLQRRRKWPNFRHKGPRLEVLAHSTDRR